MKKFKKLFYIKLKLFAPVLLGIIVAIVIITTSSIYNSNKSISLSIKQSLNLEVKTLTKMFERERALKLEKVKTSIKTIHNLFFSKNIKISNKKIKIEAINQITKQKHKTTINKILLDKEEIYNNNYLVDTIKNLFGCKSTIFQKIDSGYVRIATNVLRSDGSRAIGTYIPNSSNVIKTIEKGENYYGRAYVVNDWYITAYEPIMLKDKIIGILFVGVKEKNLDELKTIFNSVKIGNSGYAFVFDENGKIIINHSATDKNLIDKAFIKKIIKSKKGIISKGPDIIAYNYYKNFKLYIAAVVNKKAETQYISNKIIVTSIIISLIIIILLSIYIYTINSENLHKYLENLEIANSNLLSAREALKISEYKFKTIFNNISDDVFVTDMDANIIEINDVACNNLGYTKDEFLSMKIDDIKSEKYKKYIKKNREEIILKGKLNYESEHKTKEGKIISVEIKSKLADLENYKYIISIARNLTQRKEFEKKILSAVIQTEEKERERFSKEMHDGIGPLLSTIKLYVNELCSPDIDHEERKQMVEYTNELIDETISNIRTISNNLTPRIIKDYGLMKAIDAFSKKVNKTNKININYTYKGIDDKVNFEVQLILFRVVTELINNTIKHANAKNIDIFLVRNDNNIFLSYTDDGIGFNIKETINNKETGMGLKNIISRVKSINGTCIFKSGKNKGFKLSIDITI